MPFHWCSDESLLLLSMLPFIGFFFKKIHAWWHKNSLHKCHNEHCDAIHPDHVEKLDDAPINKWDEVDQALIEERFSPSLVDGLMTDVHLFGLHDVDCAEYRWFLDDNNAVKASVRNCEFIHDHRCATDGWDELVGGGRLSKCEPTKQ